MKKKISLMILGLIPFLIMPQIPVTDAIAGAQLSALNLQITLLQQNLIQTNVKLTSLEAKTDATNNELKQGNEYLKKSMMLKEEEINAYKTPADKRLTGFQIKKMIEEKKRIVTQIKNGIKNLKELKHITKGEKENVRDILSKLISQITIIYTQTAALMNASDRIIPAFERQQMLEDVLDIFDSAIRKIERNNLYLVMTNQKRKSREELIGF